MRLCVDVNNYSKGKMSFKIRDCHLQALLEFMQAHPNLASGKFVGPTGKQQQRKLWEEISRILNSLGYGVKPVQKWQKAWIDFKYSLKKKAAQNRKDKTATGGGRPTAVPLTQLEENFLNILGANFIGLTEPECGLNIENIEPLQNMEATASCSSFKNVSSEKNKTEEKRMYSSKKSISENYEKTIHILEEINTNVEKLNEITNRIHEVREELQTQNTLLTKIADAASRIADNLEELF